MDRIKLIYAGVRSDVKGNKVVCLLPVEDEGGLSGNMANERWFSRKVYTHLRRFQVGSVVSIEGEWYPVEGREELGLRGHFDTARFEEEWPFEEDRLTWATADRMARMELERERLAAEVKDPLAAALDPLREQYRRARGRHKTALLAHIVSYITG